MPNNLSRILSGTMAVGTALLAASSPAAAQPRCSTVRMVDVGWTDVTLTTAIVEDVLKNVGVEVRTELLSVPVAFASLHHGDMDVFLGNWMPSQKADIAPYLADGSVVDLGTNLEGALYTLAVPTYVYDAGVKSIADLARHGAPFHQKIYGLEPGNDGNRTVLRMMETDTYGLKGFTLVESSEQGMLAEVRRAVDRDEWVAFLGWKPHPMNLAIPMRYLADPLEAWGPGGGTSTVHTVASRKFLADCKDLGTFLGRVSFSVEEESQLMARVLEAKRPPNDVAKEWVVNHPSRIEPWLRGLPFAGPMKGPPVEAKGPPFVGLFSKGDWRPGSKVPLGRWVEAGVRRATLSMAGPMRSLSAGIEGFLEGTVQRIVQVSPLVALAVAATLTALLRRRLGPVLGVFLGGLAVWNLGYWEATVETLVLTLLAVTLAVAVGLPLGIASARRPKLHRVLLFVLDFMQTIPTFVYLIPVLMLFGLGVVPGVVATVVFAIPAPIRLAHLGISQVPRALVEAAEAFGATPWQVLLTVELPHAKKTLLEGVSQTLLLSLSMVVIAALVGAGGLGKNVVRALNNVDLGQGFEAGMIIVLLAVLLDRIVMADHKAHGPQGGLQ